MNAATGDAARPATVMYDRRTEGRLAGTIDTHSIHARWVSTTHDACTVFLLGRHHVAVRGDLRQIVTAISHPVSKAVFTTVTTL